MKRVASGVVAPSTALFFRQHWSARDRQEAEEPRVLPDLREFEAIIDVINSTPA
jgi:hypothetical protein